jgi:hypothetical protein
MGNQDNWTTPKQIKIERAGESRGLRRGPLKKGERRKGVKARLDLLLSSKKTLLRYAEWILDDRKRREEHPEWYSRGEGMWERWHEEYFDKHTKNHARLLADALRDGIIDETKTWIVEKP